MNTDLSSDAVIEADLVDLYLNDSKLVRQDHFDLNVSSDSYQQQNRLQASAEVLKSGEHKDGSPNYVFRGKLSFGLRFVALESVGTGLSEANADEPLAELAATFTALYRLPQVLPDDQMHALIEKNMIPNSWPYWREHAIRMMAEARLPRPKIPLLKSDFVLKPSSS